MSVLVFVDGSPTLSVSSLRGAMEVAEEYTYGGHRVELVARNASELCTWRFDYERWTWIESVLDRTATHPPVAVESRLAA